MEKQLFWCLCIASILNFSALVTFKCDFNDAYIHMIVGKAYRCEIMENPNITSIEEAAIEAVSGTHMSGKSNDDVIVFHADNKALEYFPKGLEKFFKNLKVIHMPHNKIKEINQAHVQPFPNLKYLEMSHSNIVVLEDGLFDNNRGLKIVWFNRNKIFHFGRNVFNNLRNMTHLGFGANQCINDFTHYSPLRVLFIIEALKRRCYDEGFANFSQNLANLEIESGNLDFERFESWRGKLEGLENKFRGSRLSYLSSIKERFFKLLKIEYQGKN